MNTDEPALPEPDEQRPAATPPIYSSEELFRGGREMWIEHAGQMYRLRITARGRLILTK